MGLDAYGAQDALAEAGKGGPPTDLTWSNILLESAVEATLWDPE